MNLARIVSIITSMILLSNAQALGAANNAGTVVLVTGTAIKTGGPVPTQLKVGDKIEEGTFVSTLANSSIKLILIDHSEMSLGSNSKVRVTAPRPNMPGNVELENGQIRSKVTKDPLAPHAPAPKIKLFIKTKSATMGVRGTDFQVIFSPENKVTSLVTFEGAVAMFKNEGGLPPPLNSPQAVQAVEQKLASEKAVNVTEGRFSSAVPQVIEASIPTKLSPAQFESMKNATIGAPPSAPASGAAGPGAPKFSVIPPGVDPKAFMSQGSGLDKQLAAMVGQPAMNAALEGDKPRAGTPLSPPPEGFYNRATGAYAPPAGGFLDFKTGLYIPPPPGSAFDPNTGVYVPPPSFGNFDPKTGGYVPPPGFQLDPLKGFVPASNAGGPGAGSGTGPGAKLPAATPGGGPGIPGVGPGIPGMGPGFLGMGPGLPLGPAPGDPNLVPFEFGVNLPPRDPYCPACSPPPAAAPPPNSSRIHFRIIVQ